MTHIICLTIDTDPDGLSGISTNRDTVSFKTLNRLLSDSFSDKLNNFLKRDIPVTWYVRVDNQLQMKCGSSLYVLEKFHAYWEDSISNKHEIGWHPHLYLFDERLNEFRLHENISDACEEIKNLHNKLKGNGYLFKSFRNGEAWQQNELFDLVEELGYETDSSIISGRAISGNTLNKNLDVVTMDCYYPSKENLSLHGPKRDLIEMPISSWQTFASYDKAPKIRYINPCVRKEIFKAAIENNIDLILSKGKDLVIWNFISHPDDIVNLTLNNDILYHHSVNDYKDNLSEFIRILQENQIAVQFETINVAANIWKKKNGYQL